jgi:hypothetical protein
MMLLGNGTKACRGTANDTDSYRIEGFEFETIAKAPEETRVREGWYQCCC